MTLGRYSCMGDYLDDRMTKDEFPYNFNNTLIMESNEMEMS